MPAEEAATLSDPHVTSLLARARQGDERAIGQLYRDYAPRIYGYLARQVGDPAVADDLCSEVFLRALEGLPRFESRGVSIVAWLYRIAHDRAVDYFRRQARRPAVPLNDELVAVEPGTEQTLDAHLRAEQLGRAIDRLTADQQQVVLLRFVADLSLQEVAHVMDKSIPAVKMLQLRALSSLREWVARTG
ncbi:MAG: sigma-70 family RNA polymerase sigma factor [Anaerolineae bacterium]|nr:sigma-70 family RNA polymerase sigma factor [Anaerolineae bacterium]